MQCLIYILTIKLNIFTQQKEWAETGLSSYRPQEDALVPKMKQTMSPLCVKAVGTDRPREKAGRTLSQREVKI